MERGEADVVGVIIGTVIITIIGLVSLPVLSEFSRRCPKSGQLGTSCDSIDLGLSIFFSNLVGPLPVIVLLLVILSGIVLGR